MNQDGGVDLNDTELFYTLWANNTNQKYHETQPGACQTTAVRFGYAGYVRDASVNNGADISNFGERNYTQAMAGLYHVRHRVYDPELGRWTRRDPIHYVDGMGLYQYAKSVPLFYLDPSGLLSLARDSLRGRFGMVPATGPTFDTHSPAPFVSVCCRDAEGWGGTFTHCELHTIGDCSGETQWETIRSTHPTSSGSMDNWLPCRCAVKADVLDCLQRNPYDTREDLPGNQPGDWPCAKDGVGPYYNCQTNTENRINKCFLDANGREPDSIASPPIGPLIPLIPRILEPLVPRPIGF
jgi:RHS repeat-associated protein